MRIKKFIVQEIALVKKPANRQPFLLLQSEDFNLDSQGGNFIMDKTEEGLELERIEELTLPPDAVNILKKTVGQLTALMGYKYKAKYTYKNQPKGEEPEQIPAELSEYTDCMAAQMKAGKSMAESAKFCKSKIKGETPPAEEDKDDKEISNELEKQLTELKKAIEDPKVSKDAKEKAIEKALEAIGGK